MEKEFGERARRMRTEQHVSLEELARRSGVSRAALSKIERGERSTSLSNAVRIAAALGVPLAQLLEPSPADLVQVVRNGAAPCLVEPDTKVTREALLEPEPGLEVVRYVMPPDTASGSFPAHEPGTRKGFIVIEGNLIATSGDDQIELFDGDAATMPGDREHQLRNPGPSTTRLILLVTRPLR